MRRSDAHLKTLKSQLIIIGTIIAFIWGLEIIDWMLGGALDSFGIQPRTSSGLRGIFWAPWLHGGFPHLMANTIPLAVLGWFILLRSTRHFALVSIATILVGGMGVWLIGGAGTNHLGASILIFGYFGYLLFAGILERSLQSLSLMFIVIFLYGSMIWGIFPIWASNISWEGHLFGFIGGAIAAYFLNPRRNATEEVLEDQIYIIED